MNFVARDCLILARTKKPACAGFFVLRSDITSWLQRVLLALQRVLRQQLPAQHPEWRLAQLEPLPEQGQRQERQLELRLFRRKQSK
ncbi:MAG: hypothetical protein HY938_11930 [Nitrosomonadales bacterium]|nr:hypothetical protein [Nitrosomonadales bacterium]